MSCKIPHPLINAIADAKLSDLMSTEIIESFSKLDLQSQKTILQHLRRHSIDDLCNDRLLKIFNPMFTVKKGKTTSAAGIGNGEVLSLLLLRNSKKSSHNGDVIYKNKVIEIKELDRSSSFRISDSIGNVFGDTLQSEMTAFYEMLEMMSLPKFNQINSCLERNFLASEYVNKTKSFKEINSSMIKSWINGFKELHDLTKHFTTNYCIMKIENQKFIINRSDFNKLNKEKFTLDPVSIDVLGKSAARKDVDILLSVIANHPYVKRPDKFELDLNKVIHKLEKDIDGFLLFYHNDNSLQCRYIISSKFAQCFSVERITEQKYKIKYNFN